MEFYRDKAGFRLKTDAGQVFQGDRDLFARRLAREMAAMDQFGRKAAAYKVASMLDDLYVIHERARLDGGR